MRKEREKRIVMKGANEVTAEQSSPVVACVQRIGRIDPFGIQNQSCGLAGRDKLRPLLEPRSRRLFFSGSIKNPIDY